MKWIQLKKMVSIPVIAVFMTAASLTVAETETDYMAILLQGKKVGHAVHIRSVEDNKVTTTERFSMTLGRGGQAVSVMSQETHVETPDGKPISFEMAMTTSGVEQKTTGTVQEGKVTISRQVMGQAQQQTIDWPEGALLNEGLRLVQEEKGLAPGTTYKVDIFRPDMMMSIPAEITIGEKMKVDLFGRVLDLTETKTTMFVQDQEIMMTGYVDDQLKAKKMLVPMMGMTLEMVACDKAFAMREDDIVDFLEKLSITSPVKLMNLRTAESASYLLEPTTEKKLELIESSSQTVEQTPDGILVTVKRIEPDKNIQFPYKGNDPQVLEALEATDYLQCKDETIAEMAKRAIGSTEDAGEAAYQIEAFVDGYITQKDLSVGYASAAEVAQSRQGDCSEHAVLTAAMCRAVGIPARIVCGVVYADSFLSKQSIFGGHMWVEVYLNGLWVGLDSTRSEQQGCGPEYIALAFGSGEPTDFFGLVNTLGCFEIKNITVNRKLEPIEVTTEQ